MLERICFFDPVHGIGLCIDAGSGRSWQDEPGGDPRYAHCRIDIPRDTLLPWPEPDQRPSSGTFFVGWDAMAAFADQLAALGSAGQARSVRLGDHFAVLSVHMRHDGRLRAYARFTQAHHVRTTVRCQTLWDWHFGVRADLPALAGQIHTAVLRLRPAPGR
jgi:hypothetical protein